MNALPLFCVLVLAKGLTLAGRDFQMSLWLPFALFWQDALVAVAFRIFERLTRAPRAHFALGVALARGADRITVPIY